MIVAVVPAQGESTRLPNKNLLLLDKRPLFYYTIKKAKESRLINKIVVSTDSQKIANLAKKYKVEIIKRDSHLCGDIPLVEVCLDAVRKLNNRNVKYVICLQIDHPTRKINIDDAIRYALKNNLDDLISVDRDGEKNGSLRIIKVTSLLEKRISVKIGTIVDDCVNIHTASDLRSAEAQLKNARNTFSQCGLLRHDRTFVIAEGACNHMGSIELAKQMIDQAKTAGADAIKFQTYKAERLVLKEAKSYWKYTSVKSQFQYYKRLDKFGKREYDILFRYARKKGILAFSTPFDIDSAQMLQDLGVPLFKIASCDIVDTRLIKKIASFRKPIIISLGAATLDEIRQAVDIVYATGNFAVALLACTLSYPTKNKDAHLLRIRKLKELFPDVVVGLSDHTNPDTNMIIPSLAVSLGASIIEKHFTLNRMWKDSGHSFSVDPRLLKQMVTNIRLAEKVLGMDMIGVLDSEKDNRKNARRSIVADIAIRKGQSIRQHMLALKRPNIGIAANQLYDIVGKKAKRSIKSDEYIKWSDIQ